MSCILKIEQRKSSLTETEEKVANYILENKREVVSMSVQELADHVEVSAAAIIRFAKKVGFTGFSELKLELAQDPEEKALDFETIIEENDGLEDLVHKSEVLNIKAIEQTYDLIDIKVLQEAIKCLSCGGNIYLFGVGASGLVAQDFQYKLARIKRVAIYQQDAHIQLVSAAHLGPKDVAIGISYSGETKEINIAMKKAKSLGAKTIGITKYNNNTLSKLVDYPLYIPNEEKEIRIGAITSRMTALIMTDLLYLGIAKNDVKQTEDYIRKTRKLIEELK